jgi:sulfonate transport system substrate-binding protein
MPVRARVGRVLLGLALAVVTAACGGAAGGGSVAAPAGKVDQASLRSTLRGQHLTLATSSLPNASLVGAYRTAQYLRDDYGLQVDLKPLEPNPEVAAILAGQVQVGAMSLAAAANADAAGADLMAFASDDVTNTFLLVARKPHTQLSDLRGLRVAVTANLAQIPGQTARACFRQAGMDLDRDVKIVHFADTGATLQALASGQVEGAVTALFRLAPYDLQEPGTFVVVCRGWQVEPQLNQLWTARRGWIAQHKELAMAIALSALKTARWTHDAKDEWMATARRITPGLSQAAAEWNYRALVQDTDNWPVDGGLDAALCAKTLQDSYQAHAVPKAYTCDQMATLSYQQAALQALGRR